MWWVCLSFVERNNIIYKKIYFVVIQFNSYSIRLLYIRDLFWLQSIRFYLVTSLFICWENVCLLLVVCVCVFFFLQHHMLVSRFSHERVLHDYVVLNRNNKDNGVQWKIIRKYYENAMCLLIRTDCLIDKETSHIHKSLQFTTKTGACLTAMHCCKYTSTDRVYDTYFKSHFHDTLEIHTHTHTLRE